MQIKKMLTQYNQYGSNDIKYIVIHYTGTTAGAKANCEYYAGGNRGASAHYYIDQSGEIWQSVPDNHGSWSVGVDYGGKLFGKCTNRNSINIEICPCKKSRATMNATDLDWYFTKEAYSSAVELTKYLMQKYGIKPEMVVRHYDVCNKWCPAPFCNNNTEYTWDRFRRDISGQATTVEYFRVAKAYQNGQYVEQLGAYESKKNAKASCPPGYKVFNKNGKVVYEVEKVAGTQASDFKALDSEKAKADKILELVKQTDHSGILWSVSAAQMILESGYVTTKLSQLGNNCFGLKLSLSGNKWDSVWDGHSYVEVQTWEVYDGDKVTVPAKFRKYPCIEDSIKDHSAYILGAMNGSEKRYDGILSASDYRETITIIKNGGYATDPDYIAKICSIVQRYGLDKYDAECRALRPAATPEPKAKKYQIQCGVFTNENHAKELSKKLSGRGIENIVVNDGGYRVIAGSFKNKAKAEKLVAQLKSKGFEAIIR